MKTALVILVLPLLIASFAIDIHFVNAKSDSLIVYSGGVTLYSPVNTTYTSNFLTLNLSFAAGLPCSLKYNIDGTYEDTLPLVANPSTGFHIITYETGIVQLPQLSEGSHCLTIYEEADLNDYHGANPPGAPFKGASPGSANYVASWVDTVDFAIASGDRAIEPTPPIIMNLSIENETYNTTDIPLNFTVDKSISKAAFCLDGKGNVTIVGNSTLTGLSSGTHNITVYAWDSAGSVGASQTINFATVNNTLTVGQHLQPFPIGSIFAALIAFTVGVALTFLFFFQKT